MVLCALSCIQYGSGIWNWRGSLFWTSLFTALVSTIPFSSGLQKTDTALLWLLLRHRERARSWMARLRLMTEDAKGTRRRHWNPDLVERALAPGVSMKEYPFLSTVELSLSLG